MKYLLTDFNLEKWNGIDINSVKGLLNNLDDVIYGEMDYQNYLTNPDIISNISHSITNLTLENNCIYGEVKFIDKNLEKISKFIDIDFDIRAFGCWDPIPHIHKFITWDVSKHDRRKLLIHDIVRI